MQTLYKRTQRKFFSVINIRLTLTSLNINVDWLKLKQRCLTSTRKKQKLIKIFLSLFAYFINKIENKQSVILVRDSPG